MTTLLNATQVGDKYRDMTGGVSTIVHLDEVRMVVRRGGAGRGWPTFSVFSASDRKVIASGIRTLAEALAA
jgi:alpha-D-ribose 1-methylphosphonate 5-triphosphate diphosphatase PhnM